MGREPLLTRAFAFAFAVSAFHSLSYYLYLHLPGFLKERGAGEDEIGLLFGVTAATAILTRPLLGRVMDLRGRRPVILAGGTLATLVCALYLTVGGLGAWAYVVRIAHGLAEAMLFASIFAFAADIIPASRRIEGIALFGVSGMMPMALGGVLGDMILARASWSALFLVSCALAAAGLLCSLPLAEPAPVSRRAPPRGFGAALAQRDLLPLWLIGLVFAIAIAAPVTFLKTYVMTIGLGSVGGFYSAYALTAIALRIGLGRLPERMGPKRVLFPSMALLGAGLVLLAVAWSGDVVRMAGVLCGIGHGYGFPILLGLVVERARSSERGAALSIFTALFDGGLLVGGPLLGAIIRASGYTTMFVATAGILAAGAAIFGIWDSGRRAG